MAALAPDAAAILRSHARYRGASFKSLYGQSRELIFLNANAGQGCARGAGLASDDSTDIAFIRANAMARRE